MIADLQSAFAFVRHVTVGACHAGTSMNPLVPHLKLRVLSLKCGCPCVSVLPVFELLLIVEGEDVFYLQPFGPRVDEPLFRPTKVISS